MVAFRIVRGVTDHFTTRYPEWVFAFILFMFGWKLLGPGDTFDSSPSYAVMNRLANEVVWGWSIVAIAGARLVALALNGTFASVRAGVASRAHDRRDLLLRRVVRDRAWRAARQSRGERAIGPITDSWSATSSTACWSQATRARQNGGGAMIVGDSGPDILPQWQQVALGAALFVTTVAGQVWRFFAAQRKSSTDRVELEVAELADMRPVRRALEDLAPGLKKLGEVDAKNDQILDLLRQIERRQELDRRVSEEVERRLRDRLEQGRR